MSNFPPRLQEIHNTVKRVALECMVTNRHRSIVDVYVYGNKDVDFSFFEKIRRVWMILNLTQSYSISLQSDYKLTYNQLKEAMDILRGILGYTVEDENNETH